MAHPIYAVVENRGGYKKVGTEFVPDPDGRSHYLKKFQDKATFDAWVVMMCGPTGHISVIKKWTDRPPCAELQAIKAEYAATWMNTP